MTDSTHDDLDGIRRGGRARALFVLALLSLLGLATWLLLWPSGHGEPELPHRVLIVGGLESDLAAAVHPAGFDADQRGWPALEAELGGAPTYDALVELADAGGYGFLAIVFDAGAPWTPEALGASTELPTDSEVVVTSIGRMRVDGEEVSSAGKTLAQVEYPEGTRRPEALRLALYTHPDLEQFWDDPTPEQRTWRTPIARLPNERKRLEARAQAITQALASWPASFPDDAIHHPWLGLSAHPVAGGLLLRRRSERLRMSSTLEVELFAERDEVVWVAREDIARPGAVAEAEALELSVDNLRRLDFEIAPNGEFFSVSLDQEAQFELWSVQPGRAPRHERSISYSTRLKDQHNQLTQRVRLSNHGELLASASSSFAIGPSDFLVDSGLEVEDIAWSGELAVALLRGSRGRGCDSCESLVFIDTADAFPRLLTIDLDTLMNVPEASETHASVHELVSSRDGVFALVSDRSPRTRFKLVKLEIPPMALSSLQADPDYGYTPQELWSASRRVWLTNAQLDACARPLAELRELPHTDLRVVAQLPEVWELFVSSTGEQVAWSSDDDRQVLYVAAIEAAGLGEAVVIGGLERSDWNTDTFAGFEISADTFVVNDRQAREGLSSPADFARRILLPPGG